MDWKAAALLLIFSGIFILSSLRKTLPKDLLFLIGGSVTLLIGITPAKEFMYHLTSGTFLASAALFVLAFVFKEPLFDRTIRIQRVRDFFALVPESVWLYALSGVLFAAAFEQTALPAQVASSLFWMLGSSPFLIVAFLLCILYLVAHFLHPAFVMIVAFPFAYEALQFSTAVGDATAAAIPLLAAIFSMLNAKTRERVHLKVRAPLLILILITCAFLIPQF